MLLKGLLASDIATCEWHVGMPLAPLYDVEARSVRSAVDCRRQEFQAGRTCARHAFMALGLQPQPIPVGPDRAPIWPPGFTGSISHSKTYCVAAVGRCSPHLASIGVDIECDDAVEPALASEICLPQERNWIERQPPIDQRRLLTAIFSAKECAYKCQYGLTGTLLGFEALSIELDPDSGVFSAVFQRPLPPFSNAARLVGRFRFVHGHVVTAMILPLSNPTLLV